MELFKQCVVLFCFRWLSKHVRSRNMIDQWLHVILRRTDPNLTKKNQPFYDKKSKKSLLLSCEINFTFHPCEYLMRTGVIHDKIASRHSSRMRTAHLLTISWGSAFGGTDGGSAFWRGLPAPWHCGKPDLPCGQKHLKTLPCPILRIWVVNISATLQFLQLTVTNVVPDKEKVKHAEICPVGISCPNHSIILWEIRACTRTWKDTLPKGSLQDGN